MDILIKSFNRPYYLDRCLQSVIQYVTGYQKIILLEDGTPEKYLSKILEKYPYVSLAKSSNYEIKVKKTALGIDPNLDEIPVELWNSVINKAHDYALVIEEDMWFIAPIDLKALSELLKKHKVAMLKLFWLGNPNLIQAQGYHQLADFDLFELRPIQTNAWWYYVMYYRFHRLKFLKQFFGFYNPTQKLSYYSVYGVAGMIFQKDYYLATWQNPQNKVYENQQILNGLRFLQKHKVQFGKTKDEVIKTGFISSSSNSDSIKGQAVCQYQLNLFLNEAWLQHNFDVLENFPNDFSVSYLQSLLKESQIDEQAWQRWYQQFTRHYINLGCKI